MKIHCSKCHKTLTEDLYKTSVRWVPGILGTPTVKDASKICTKDDKVKKGLFFEEPSWQAYSNKWDDNEPAQILKQTQRSVVVSEQSVLEGVVPKFVDGYGCCDWSGGMPLSCECGNHLGDMHLDCYEDGSVQFVSKNITRKY